MVKKKRKGTNKQKKGPAKKLKVIKAPGSAVLRGCKKTKRMLMAHFQLRAEVHSQLRVIASLFVLRIFLTCLVGYPNPGARLAVLAPAAPTGPPLPLDSEDPVMLRQLKDFVDPNRPELRRPEPDSLQPAAAAAALCQAVRQGAGARLNRSGKEAQLCIKMACGYGINAQSSELQAATLDKGHVAEMREAADKHRRLLNMMKQGSLQDTLPLPCRMRHAIHVCRWLEQWQQPPTPPVPGQPMRGKRRGGPRTLTCPPPFTLTPMPRVGVHFIKLGSRVLRRVCKQLGLIKESQRAFISEPALSQHWARWFNTGKLRNKGFQFERTVKTYGVSVCVHYTRPLPTPPAPPPAASSNSRPSAAAAAAHAVGLPHIGRGIAEQREVVFDPATQIGVGIDPDVTQAVSAASGRWLAPIKPHLQHLAAASPAGTSLVANLKHITVTMATWDAVWEVYLDPKWARQRLRLYGAHDRTLEQFFKKLEDMAEVSMERHGHATQLVVFLEQLVLALGGPPQVPCSSQEATPAAASGPGPSTPPPAKRSKRTKAEQAVEAQGNAAKAKPTAQPGRWLDRDCNAALNMQRIGESRWQPLELCYWPEQGKLPAKGKEYPGLGYKRVRGKPPKAQQELAEAQ
ncbi:hypothetical protein QJQ45_000081 [Haematococcus lacustris]|nr:hypothetical protein QJQ45_000081 [Haematococcus lacustris]